LILEARKRVRDMCAHGLTAEIRNVAKVAFDDLQSAGCRITELWPCEVFKLGYICGMKNPDFETVKKSVEVMRSFSELNDNEKEKQLDELKRVFKGLDDREELLKALEADDKESRYENARVRDVDDE
jgi:diphthamide synthase (EF-2-diphthine--ammonia ligase)